VSDTDDLVQETLLHTFRRLGQFEPRGVGALQAYLRQAILNRIREELRRKGRRPQETDLSGLELDTNLSPLEQAIGGQAVENYERALARLRVEEQEAIIGRIEMGYTYDELAEALGKPTADAARKAAQRALVRLIEEMDGEDR
jgi:RNA polymerase sigma-70 factor (ECF subfamily)